MNNQTFPINFLRRIYSFILRAFRLLRGMYWTIIIRALGGHVGNGLRVGPRLLFKIPPHNGISIGSNVSIGADIVIDVPEGGKLTLGNRVKLNHAVVVAAQLEIVLGDDVIVGEYTSIRDADHGMSLCNKAMQYQPMRALPVHIGKDVWIARGVAILKGCEISNGVVVGANSVVSRGLPENSIAVGIPARVISERSE